MQKVPTPHHHFHTLRLSNTLQTFRKHPAPEHVQEYRVLVDLRRNVKFVALVQKPLQEALHALFPSSTGKKRIKTSSWPCAFKHQLAYMPACQMPCPSIRPHEFRSRKNFQSLISATVTPLAYLTDT